MLGGSLMMCGVARGDVGNSRRQNGMNVGWQRLKEENDIERREGSGHNKEEDDGQKKEEDDRRKGSD